MRGAAEQLRVAGDVARSLLCGSPVCCSAASRMSFRFYVVKTQERIIVGETDCEHLATKYADDLCAMFPGQRFEAFKIKL